MLSLGLTSSLQVLLLAVTSSYQAVVLVGTVREVIFGFLQSGRGLVVLRLGFEELALALLLLRDRGKMLVSRAIKGSVEL